MFFGGEEEIFNDKIVLRDILDVFIREDDIFFLVDLKVNIDEFLPFGLYFLFTKIPIPELDDLNIKIKDDHTILPPLKSNILRHDIRSELYEDIILQFCILMIKG